MRKMFCAAIALLVSCSFASAETFFASITKVEDGKITISKRKKGSRKGVVSTLKLASSVTVKQGKASFKNKKFSIAVGDKLEGGLKNKVFKNIGKKGKGKKGKGRRRGVFAQITTNSDGAVTQITVVQFQRRKKKDI